MKLGRVRKRIVKQEVEWIISRWYLECDLFDWRMIYI